MSLGARPWTDAPTEVPVVRSAGPSPRQQESCPPHGGTEEGERSERIDGLKLDVAGAPLWASPSVQELHGHFFGALDCALGAAPRAQVQTRCGMSSVRVSTKVKT